MKDNNRKCAKCNASTAQHSDLVLHRFPKPAPSNVERTVAWAKFCYPEENWNCVEFQRSLFVSHKMLCSKHFPESAFVQDHLQRKKLHRYSIPSEVEMSIADTGSNEQPGTARASDSMDSSNVLVVTQTSLPVQVPTILCEPTTDILKVCRVCLAMDVKMYDLKDIELREMFQNITGIAVTENNHPILERLCWECAGRLKAAAAFRNKALLSDVLLQGLANTGEQIRKRDITLIKDSEDYLKTAATLTAVEAFHTVDIDPENDGIPPLSENNEAKIVQNTVRKDFLKLKNKNIDAKDNDQTDVEDESMTEATINTEVEYDQFDHICPNTREESSNVVLETNPLFSSNIPLEEHTINSANSSPPPSCSHVKPKFPIRYLLKTPGDYEDEIKNHVIKITKRDSISKIVFINSKELISAKSKNMNVKIGGISKKTSNLKLLKYTQVKANTPTDEESLSLENFEF